MSDTLPPLRDVLARHGLRADKKLGQHFLLDLNLTGRIARAAGNLKTGTTIEVGPGPGGLTRALLAEGATVVAIERDQRCLPIMAEIGNAYPGKFSVVMADAMSVDLRTLGAAPLRIVANLPYNVGTDLLINWLGYANAFESMTLMFQSEVGDRLAAAPGSKTYGRLSVLAQWLCDVSPQFRIGPQAFTPPPQVESTVVRLVPLPKPRAPADQKTLERVTAAAFGQRRKMLRQSLKTLAADAGFADGTALCEAVSIDPQARAETLSVEDFCALARAVSEKR
ncbi:MAG: 16S rRNA (adenine(1518)-N(6)/adenine(1519)-N(6))-dimethyltransferase RsmA [Rhodospirillaceae bacterium]|nr:16S rRNA (adenine(1518)-N(6)/adenine(1519)-N(6))-dimethyltransferase RsmA [Rhodospirillaceae bacterium]